MTKRKYIWTIFLILVWGFAAGWCLGTAHTRSQCASAKTDYHTGAGYVIAKTETAPMQTWESVCPKDEPHDPRLPFCVVAPDFDAIPDAHGNVGSVCYRVALREDGSGNSDQTQVRCPAPPVPAKPPAAATKRMHADIWTRVGNILIAPAAPDDSSKPPAGPGQNEVIMCVPQDALPCPNGHFRMAHAMSDLDAPLEPPQFVLAKKWDTSAVSTNDNFIEFEEEKCKAVNMICSDPKFSKGMWHLRETTVYCEDQSRVLLRSEDGKHWCMATSNTKD
jgi:hypothetical protein